MERHNPMNEIVTESLHVAQRLLRTKQYKEALRVLGEIDVLSISPHDRAWYNLLFVEAHLSLGNYDLESVIQETHEYFIANNDVYGLARIKYLHARMLIALGRLFDAREQCFEAYLLFRKIDDYAWQGRSLNRLSFIAYHIGEIESAINYLERCRKLYADNGDKNNMISISINLSQLLFALGRLSDSIKLYSEIEPQIKTFDYEKVGIFYFMFAVPYALKGDFGKAEATIIKADSYLHDLTREQAIYSENWGWIYNLEGEYVKALNALRQGLDISLRIAPQSALVSQIKRRMADAYVGLGEHDVARKIAGEAFSVAEKLNERAEIAACYRVFAQVEAVAANAGAAKDWFGKATELFSMIGSRYELAVTRYLAAISGFYINGERQALLYLAREYFESENVGHYVSKINRELSEIPLTRSRPAHINGGVPTIICRDPSMIQLVELARHIAPSNMSVLLTGPTGCGKDLFARFIHYHSGRKGRFVSVNAAAIPDNMVESELFGYRKGAYTGAANTTSGWIEEADGGTFYLNEIADSSPELQAKLLDVIENRRVCRLGERQEREINCRIIAATNHDLDKLIDRGRFRLDLFHRLNEIPIQIPGLAERGADIAYLLEHFLKSAGVPITTRADRAAFDHLASVFATRPWRGNVRELEIEVKRLTLLSRNDITRMVDSVITHLPSKKDETQAALDQTGWNRREAARLLGISESTVRHRIKNYSLTRKNP
jgi:DNA-binding NtrC family response regulator/tetratricopeptide (TPR) repeat protein